MVEVTIPVRDGPVPMGDNRPPMRLTAEAELREELTEGFAKRRDQFIMAMGNAVVRDVETCGQAADIIVLADDVWKLIDGTRRAHAQPFIETADALTLLANRFWSDVANGTERVRGLVETFKAENKKRIQDQQAEQEAEEQRLRDAAAPAAAPRPATAPPAPAMRRARATPIVGDYGGKVVDVDQHTYVIEDVLKVPLWILNSDKVHAAIAAVAKDVGKHMKEIPGIRRDTTTATQIRKR